MKVLDLINVTAGVQKFRIYVQENDREVIHYEGPWDKVPEKLRHRDIELLEASDKYMLDVFII